MANPPHKVLRESYGRPGRFTSQFLYRADSVPELAAWAVTRIRETASAARRQRSISLRMPAIRQPCACADRSDHFSHCSKESHMTILSNNSPAAGRHPAVTTLLFGTIGLSLGFLLFARVSVT